MSQEQSVQNMFDKSDPIEECVTFFNTQRQARLLPQDIQKNLHKLKKIASHLNLADETELLQHANKGNAKCLSAIEALLLRPHHGFFEGAGMYKFFTTTLLPQLINQNSTSKKISIWVPGCAEGHEAYSLALIFHAHLKELENWDFSIEATDTDSNSLKQAETASFDIEDIDQVIFELYKDGLKKNGHEYIIQSSVRDLISFHHNNFYDSAPPENLYDVIVFRNQLSNWQPDLQEKIVSNLEKSLKPHGHLILAYGESLLGLSSNFTSTKAIQGFYQKAS